MSHRPIRAVSRMLWAGPLVLACAGEHGESGPRTHTVEIREMEFHPGELRVSPGDTVVWINRDIVPHTATDPDSAWTSPPLDQGDRWRTVAPALGTGTYICAFHPVMEARLIVERPSSLREQTP